MAFAAAGGAMGYATASPIQTLGNHFYFGDPIPSLGNQLVGLGIGAATGGIMNGTLAAVYDLILLLSFNRYQNSHVEI